MPETTTVCTSLSIQWEYQGIADFGRRFPVEASAAISVGGSNVDVVGYFKDPRFSDGSTWGISRYALDSGALMDRSYGWVSFPRQTGLESAYLRRVASSSAGTGFVTGSASNVGLAGQYFGDGFITWYFSEGMVSAVATHERFVAFGGGAYGEGFWAQLHQIGMTGFADLRTESALKVIRLPDRPDALAITDAGKVFATGYRIELAGSTVRDNAIGTSYLGKEEPVLLARLSRGTVGLVADPVSTSSTALVQIWPLDIVATSDAVYVAGGARLAGSSDEYRATISRFDFEGNRIWGVWFPDSDGIAVNVRADPATGRIYVVAGADEHVARRQERGVLSVVAVDGESGSTVGYWKCEPTEGWRFEIAGFDLVPGGDVVISGMKMFTDPFYSGGGRGFVLRASLP